MVDKNFYSRLKRLFSSGTIIRKVGGKKLKVKDTDRMQATVSNMMRERYARLHSSGYGGAQSGAYTMNMAYQSQRIMLFRDYDIMDMDPIITSILDIYADESTVKSENGNVLEIETDNQDIKDVLHNLYYDILNVEFNLYMWIRSLCKYGDFYLFLEISPKYGIHNVIPLSVYDTIRVEGSDPENPFYVYFETMGATGQKQKLENFEMAHFRIIGDPNFLPYGKCLTADTYVDTEYGTQYISDLNEGDNVWTYNIETDEMELSSVKAKVNSGIKKVLKISTQHNFIKASESHPILVHDGSNMVYKKAEDIEIGDLLVVNTNNNKKSREVPLNKNLPGFNKNGWKNTLDSFPDHFTPEFARLFGFLIGDGWCDTHNDTVAFATGVDESMNEYYTGLLEKYSGKSSIRRPPTSTSGGQVWVNSKCAKTVLQQNGFVGTAKTKRIPQWVFEAPSDIQMAFIRGLTDADGSTHDDGHAVRYQLMLCNKDLVYDMKRLLQLNNIKSSIPHEDDEIREVEICGTKSVQNGKYYIYYYLEGKLKEQVAKYDRINSDSVMTEPVRRIEDIGEDETWDIQVDSSNSNFIANGLVVHNSILEGGRRTFRQLIMAEDAMLIHRIMRAPEKRAYYIDVGNIAPHEVDAYMQEIMAKSKKVPFIDPSSGEYNMKYNMQNIMEDFYFPVRGSDSGTKIENVGGLEYQAIDDIEYLKNRMLAAFKVPKAFIGYDESISGKTTLAAEDARFARTIERVQRIVETELTKIGVIHLYSQGYDDEELLNFNVKLTNPSIIYEQEKVALWKERLVLARDMKESRMLSDDFIYEHIFNLSDDVVSDERKKIVTDVKRQFRYEQIQQGAPDPAKTGFPQDSPDAAAAMGGGEDPLAGLGGEGEPPPEAPMGEVSNRGPGQPKKGMTYGQDSHPRGRDPLGSDELYKTNKEKKRTRKDKDRFPLSGLSKESVSNSDTARALMEKKIPDAKELWAGVDDKRSETSSTSEEDKGTYLDESVLE